MNERGEERALLIPRVVQHYSEIILIPIDGPLESDIGTYYDSNVENAP